MNREFQLLYRTAADGPVLVVNVVAETEEEARGLLEPSGLTVLSAREIRQVIDWEQVWFTREEAAVYLRCSAAKIDKLMAAGKLRKARDGRPRFHRRELDAIGSENAQVVEAA
jgi:excisionase family DNA binding protein